MPESRPNIVLVMVDQWRGDCLSIDGHPDVRTPYLDRLALSGARCSRAYSSCPTCIAARAGLFTGLGQDRHGRVGYQDGVPWDYQTTLAGEFTNHGYQTQAVGKMHVFPERSQLGFQNVILHDGYLHWARRMNRQLGMVDDYLPWLREQTGHNEDYFDHGLDCNSVVARPWDKPERLHPTNYVVSQSIDFLRRRDPRKPFMLFMSFHRPHPPYDPPAWAFEQYLDAPLHEPPVGDWTALFAQHSSPNDPAAFVGPVDRRSLRRAMAGYYGHMSHIDQQVNRFLEVLGEFGLREQTYVCFTADHGELMGDHHLFRKGFPYEGSARVPLILAGPPDSGIRRNSQIGQVAELRDVMPTLLDCAGLPAPAGLDGQTLLPLARGETSANWRTYLHGEHTLNVGPGHMPGALHWITDGHSKYVWFSASGDEQLFDLDQDPQELHDLGRCASEPPVAAEMERWRSALIHELAGREEGFVADGRLVAGRAVKPVLAQTGDAK